MRVVQWRTDALLYEAKGESCVATESKRGVGSRTTTPPLVPCMAWDGMDHEKRDDGDLEAASVCRENKLNS